jgi:hypothetical protein
MKEGDLMVGKAIGLAFFPVVAINQIFPLKEQR